MEGVAEALYSIKNTAKGLTPQKIRQGLRTIVAESENIFSRCARQLLSRKLLFRTPDEYYVGARALTQVRTYEDYVTLGAHA